MRSKKAYPDPETSPFVRAVRRASMPEVLYVDDIAVALLLDLSEAERLLRAGELGPMVLIDGRPAILREALLSHLRRASAMPGLPGTVSGPIA